MEDILGADAAGVVNDAVETCAYAGALDDVGMYTPTERIPPTRDDFDEEVFGQKAASSLEDVVSSPIGRHFLTLAAAQEIKVEVVRSMSLFHDVQEFCTNPMPSSMSLRVLCAKHPEKLKSIDGSTEEAFKPEEVKESLQRVLEGSRANLDEVFKGLKGNSEIYRAFLAAKDFSMRPVTTEHIRQYRSIGRGGFGSVFGGKLHTIGWMLAIKTMNMKHIESKKAANVVTSERDALLRLAEHRSPFCLHLVYAFMREDDYVIVMPLAIGGDLSFHLKQEKGYFELKRARLYAAEICLGLHHMHTLDILYRDLKPENILLDTNGRCKISDFGLAINVPGLLRGGKTNGRAGTSGFWAPEVITPEGMYGYESDWWSFGCLLFCFFVGRTPFHRSITGIKDMNQAILEWDVKLPKSVDWINPKKLLPGGSANLIKGCLNRSSEARMHMGNGLIEAAFFEKIDFVRVSQGQIKAPWKPEKGMLYVPPQDLIDKKNKENEAELRNVEVSSNIRAETFSYVNTRDHEEHIVEILKMESDGRLNYLPALKGAGGSKSGCAIN